MVKFRSEKISEHVTRIHGLVDELMYLVEGDRKAALIDTGSGVGSLKTYVQGLTAKPYVILLTHGHVDHAMGAPEFDVPAYMNPEDDGVCAEHGSMEVRKGSLAMAEDFAAVEEADYIPVRTGPYLPLREGDTFDLGGITLKAFSCPGHTPGSMVILLCEERTLLLGDACNPFTFLFDHNSCGVASYRSALLELKRKTDGSYDRVYLSHAGGDGPKEMLDGVLEVCDDILAGRTDDIPFEFMGETALIAKAMTPEMKRKDGGIGNIVYRKEKILL